MDSNSWNKRGFTKTKLMPFYKSVKPSSASAMHCSMSYKARSPLYSSQYAYPHPQDYGGGGPAPKVSFVVAASAEESNSRERKLSQLAERLYGVANVDDHSVDLKAASYISSVRERFGLEWMTSESVEGPEAPVEICMVMNEEAST